MAVKKSKRKKLLNDYPERDKILFKKLEEQLKNANEKLEVLNDKKEDVQELSKEHKNL